MWPEGSSVPRETKERLWESSQAEIAAPCPLYSPHVETPQPHGHCTALSLGLPGVLLVPSESARDTSSFNDAETKTETTTSPHTPQKIKINKYQTPTGDR